MRRHATGEGQHRQDSDAYGRGVHFGVLGPVEVSEKRRQLPTGGPKQRTVLALLIARVGQPVSTDTLVDGVYGDDPPRGARRSIQTYVSNLRSEVGEAISATGSGYVLNARREELEISLEFFDGGTQLLVAVYFVPPIDREHEPPPPAAGLYAFDVAPVGSARNSSPVAAGPPSQPTNSPRRSLQMRRATCSLSSRTTAMVSPAVDTAVNRRSQMSTS